jgi:hypothetical protein
VFFLHGGRWSFFGCIQWWVNIMLADKCIIISVADKRTWTSNSSFIKRCTSGSYWVGTECVVCGYITTHVPDNFHQYIALVISDGQVAQLLPSTWCVIAVDVLTLPSIFHLSKPNNSSDCKLWRASPEYWFPWLHLSWRRGVQNVWRCTLHSRCHTLLLQCSEMVPRWHWQYNLHCW